MQDSASDMQAATEAGEVEAKNCSNAFLNFSFFNDVEINIIYMQMKIRRY